LIIFARREKGRDWIFESLGASLSFMEGRCARLF